MSRIGVLKLAQVSLLILGMCQCITAQRLIGDSLSKKAPFKIKRMANQSLRYNDTYSAIELLEIYVSKRPKRTSSQLELAQLYQKTRNYDKALELYTKITNESTELFPKAWFYKGQCHKNLEQFDSARASFIAFSERYRGLKDRSQYRRLLKTELAGLDIADSLFVNKLPALVTPIKGLNQRHTESGPAFLSDTIMYYSSISEDRLPIVDLNDSLESIPRLKIYVSRQVEGKWESDGLLMSEINDPIKHICNPILGPNGDYLYYSVCSENWQGKVICDIYRSRKINGKWKRPEPLPGVNVSGFTSTQPAIGLEPKRNRTIVYFVSDRPGGRGGLDIYWTRYNKRNEEWSKPRNAGGKINSVGNEETPWYDQGRGTLYFSSNGHPGIGGMDIFSSVGEGSSWSEPEILGVPINSTADDIYFRKQPRDRYQILVSNRPGSLSLWNTTCCDDIYEVFYPTNMDMLLKITARKITNEEQGISGTPPLLDQGIAKVYLYDSKTGEKFLITRDSLVNGRIDLNVTPGKTYLVEVERPGYFTESRILNLQKNNVSDTAETELILKKWDEKPITIPKVYFEFGSAEMTAESKTTIDTTILKLMIQNPSIIIEIGAHTDSKGSDELNMKLSQKRAESISKYLTSKGVEKDRISGRGYGETMPIAPNTNPDGSDNPDGRAMNRRVDFKVTGTKLDIRQAD